MQKPEQSFFRFFVSVFILWVGAVVLIGILTYLEIFGLPRSLILFGVAVMLIFALRQRGVKFRFF